MNSHLLLLVHLHAVIVKMILTDFVIHLQVALHHVPLVMVHLRLTVNLVVQAKPSIKDNA